jgi:hypothetical protein
LKIPKGQSETTNRTKTNNAMAKRQKHKSTNNDLKHITQTTKEQVTRTPLKSKVDSSAPEGLLILAPCVTPVVLLLNNTNIICYGNRVAHRYA